ncbi:Carboxyl-terminal protease [invertebrate metagenome]|uniref:Carboxyl-terminal protease n=1 Tax=invertebrate metagenome TaxID=1711999 RepID=A0A484H9J7_9ZZZZ
MKQALTFTLGVMLVLLSEMARAIPQGEKDTYLFLDLFGAAFERARRDYVDRISDQRLVESAINGMLSALDPHSSYLNVKNYHEMQVQTKGEFGGLGIEVTLDSSWVRVISPLDETPAARAGIRPGDYITHLDGEAVLGMSLSEAVDKMRGPPDSDIRLTVRREGGKPFDLTLTRAIITIQSVKGRVEGGDIGYLRITSFTDRTEPSLHQALREIKAQTHNHLKGYVLDLRNNPGGLLDQAILVADTFLDRGEIVSTRSRRAEDIQRYNARKGDMADNLPLVVLINDGSASAAEIVAGALQDHKRAILVGTRSFGKGSVQTIVPLHDNGAIRLTTARYYTPSGRSIQTIGVAPDIVVEQARLQVLSTNGQTHNEASLRHALGEDVLSADLLSDDLLGPDTADETAPVPLPSVLSTGARHHSVEERREDKQEGGIKLGSPEDYQLARALDLLRGVSIYRAAAHRR